MGKITTGNLLNILGTKVPSASSSSETKNHINSEESIHQTKNRLVAQTQNSARQSSDPASSKLDNDNKQRKFWSSEEQSTMHLQKTTSSNITRQNENTPIGNTFNNSLNEEIATKMERQLRLLKEDFKANLEPLLQELQQEVNLRKRLEQENIQLRKSLEDSKQLIDELCKQIEMQLDNMPEHS